MRKQVVLAVVLCGAVSWSAAVAQEPGNPRQSSGGRQPGGPPEAREGRIGRLLSRPEILRELGLSPEQIAALKDQAFALEQERIKARAELDLAALEQAKLLTDDSSKESAILEAVEKTGKFRTALAKLDIREILLVKANLTPEQRGRMRQMMAKHAQERWGSQARPEETDRNERQQSQEWRAHNQRRQQADAPPAAPPGEPPPDPGE